MADSTDRGNYVADDGNGVQMPPNGVIMQESWRDLFVGIPKRLLCLLKKMIGVKMLVWYATSWMTIRGYLPAWSWVVVTGFVLAGREWMKYVKGAVR